MDSHWQPPTEFDDYLLLQPLGTGSTGQVYLAEDQVLARRVAGKFATVPQPEAALRQRFLIEARAAARVQHPNVVSIYRVGELEDRPYLITEFVRGRSLEQIEKPMPWERALAIGIDLSRGLSAAHRNGVVHCDIKSANAILPEEGGAKLLDLGWRRSSRLPRTAPSVVQLPEERASAGLPPTWRRRSGAARRPPGAATSTAWERSSSSSSPGNRPSTTFRRATCPGSCRSASRARSDRAPDRRRRASPPWSNAACAAIPPSGTPPATKCGRRSSRRRA